MAQDITLPDYKFEAKLTERDGFKYVVGVDEVGRGPGAGPVVACAVHVPENMVKSLQGRLKDSKKMTKKQRNQMYVVLTTSCPYGLGIVDNTVIDEINILAATKLAMQKAIAELPEADYALVDGNMKMDNLNIPYESLIKGDSRSLSISAGAVIAKVTRDRIMAKYHDEYPVYGWDTNSGYLSKKHLEGIEKHGTTPYHRMSFKRVGR